MTQPRRKPPQQDGGCSTCGSAVLVIEVQLGPAAAPRRATRAAIPAAVAALAASVPPAAVDVVQSKSELCVVVVEFEPAPRMSRMRKDVLLGAIKFIRGEAYMRSSFENMMSTFPVLFVILRDGLDVGHYVRRARAGYECPTSSV